jgi:hypothetical protein
MEYTALESLEHIDPGPKTFEFGTSREKAQNRGKHEGA